MRDLLVSHCTRFFSPFPLITFPPAITFSFSCPILANEMRCGSACMSFDRAHPNRVVYPYHAAISYAFDYRGWQVKHSLPIQTKCVGANIHAQSTQTTSTVPRTIFPNEINRPRAILSREIVGAVPACPPERPHSGVSIPKTHALCAGMNDGCAPAGRHGRAHRRRPYQSPPNHAECYYLITLYIRQFTPTTRCAHPPPYCTFDSSKPRVLS